MTIKASQNYVQPRGKAVISEPESKYRMLKRTLLQNISEGKINPGDRFPTEAELCQAYQISRHTVGRTLSELQAEGYITRHQGKGTFVSEIAPARVTNPTSMVAMLGGDFTNSLEMLIATVTRKALMKSNRDLVMWGTDGDEGKEEAYLVRAVDIGLAGLIWWPPLYVRDENRITRLFPRPFPTVMIDRAYPEIDCPAVIPDHYFGMRSAVEYLIRVGHRRIAFLTFDEHMHSSLGVLQEREQAYLDAMHAAGLKVRPEWIARTDPGLSRQLCGHPKLAHSLAYEPTHRLMMLTPRPTAIVCLFDELALGAYRAIRNTGLRVPDDVSLVGFDDSPIAQAMDVPLTTVHYPAQRVGELAVDMLEKIIAGETLEEKRIIVPTELMVRASAMAPRTESEP